MKTRTKTLEEIALNFDKNRIPLSLAERLNLQKIYPYYGAQGIIDYVDRFLFDGEYILVAEDGENLKSQKTPICNLVRGKFWVNNHAHIIQANAENDTEFIYYLLNSINFRPFITGSAQPKLTKENLNSITLNVPDLTTQRKIAAVLCVLDAKIELNRRINAELEALAKTLYDYWFVQFDFPDAQGKPYKSSGGKMVWSEALKREVPEGWEVGKIEDLGEIVGGSTPSKENSEYFSESGIPWITPKDLSLNVGNKFISKGEIDVSEKGLKAASLKIMPAGTVLLSSRAPIGYLAISRSNVTTNQGFKSIIPANGFSSQYVFYVLKNLVPTFEQKAVGSTFKEISAGTLKGIEIDLPPRKIIQQFTNIVKSIFERQDQLETENHHLTALRDWLLPLLMNGQVRVG